MKLPWCTCIHHQRFSNITRAKPQTIVHCHWGKLNITKQSLISSLIVIFWGQGEHMKKFNCKEKKKTKQDPPPRQVKNAIPCSTPKSL
jgi:hypothetical protein